MTRVQVRTALLWGSLAAGLLLGGLMGSMLRTGLGFTADLLIGLAVGGSVWALLALLMALLLAVIRRTPAMPLASVIGAAVLYALVMGLFRVPLLVGLRAGLLVSLTIALLIAGGSGLWRARRESLPQRVKWISAGLLVAGIGLMVAGGLWLAGEGPGSRIAADRSVPVAVTAAPRRPALANPAERGPYAVNRLTYGSGLPRHRPEYGRDAFLTTATVDGSALVKGWTGLKGRVREWFWGFSPARFPVNGMVWYPEGDGPFPLVFMVHGNHQMEEASEPGYAYLGDLLASRGFIAVSVDENFLNTSWSGDLKSDGGARAWLLLKHLEVWSAWNTTAGNPFYGKVDLDRIALIGHSRGGEAAVVAAALNQLSRHPDDAGVAVGAKFGIRSVVAIAPSEGQYRMAGRPTVVKDVNYLLLQGANDADSASFWGIRQYQRVRFTGGAYRFKAAVYIYGANHGQFNTAWRTDFPRPWSWLLNRGALLGEQEQQQVARIYISAFLEATLHDNQEYLPLFQNQRFGEGWLPTTRYITQYEDSAFHLLADYEEDVDVTTTTVPGGEIAATGLVAWKEEALRFREGSSQENQVVSLSWNIGDAASPSYEIRLPPGLAEEWHLTGESVLSFKMATQGGSSATAPIDLTVEVVAAGGAAAEVPLGSFCRVEPPWPVVFTKLRAIDRAIYREPLEPVLQTCELPLAAFMAHNPSFVPNQLVQVRLRFDRSASGTLLLDRLGFRTVP